MYPKVCTENSLWLPVNWLHREPIQVLHFGDAFLLDSGPWRNQCGREQVGRSKIWVIYILKHKYVNDPNRTRHYYTTNGLPLTSLLQYGSTNLGLLGYQASSEKINLWLFFAWINWKTSLSSLFQGNGAYPLYANYPQQVLANQNPQSSFVQVLHPFVVVLTPLCFWARFCATFLAIDFEPDGLTFSNVLAPPLLLLLTHDLVTC